MYKTHNEEAISPDRLFAVGAVRAKYSDLVNLFGQPILHTGETLEVEWRIRFGSRTAAVTNYVGTTSKTPTIENTALWMLAGDDAAVYFDLQQILTDPVAAIRKKIV